MTVVSGTFWMEGVVKTNPAASLLPGVAGAMVVVREGGNGQGYAQPFHSKHTAPTRARLLPQGN
jgi:hypothetical protein